MEKQYIINDQIEYYQIDADLNIIKIDKITPKPDQTIINLIKDYDYQHKFIQDYVSTLVLNMWPMQRYLQYYENEIKVYYDQFFSAIGLTKRFNAIQILADCDLLKELENIDQNDKYTDINNSNNKPIITT